MLPGTFDPVAMKFENRKAANTPEKMPSIDMVNEMMYGFRCMPNGCRSASASIKWASMCRYTNRKVAKVSVPMAAVAAPRVKA